MKLTDTLMGCTAYNSEWTMMYRKCPESFSHESGTFYDLDQLILL